MSKRDRFWVLFAISSETNRVASFNSFYVKDTLTDDKTDTLTDDKKFLKKTTLTINVTK